MAHDLSAVGNAATAAKSETDLADPGIAIAEVGLRRSADGGYEVIEHYRRQPRRGSSEPTHQSAQIEPRRYEFATFAAAVIHLRGVFGPDDHTTRRGR